MWGQKGRLTWGLHRITNESIVVKEKSSQRTRESPSFGSPSLNGFKHFIITREYRYANSYTNSSDNHFQLLFTSEPHLQELFALWKSHDIGCLDATKADNTGPRSKTSEIGTRPGAIQLDIISIKHYDFRNRNPNQIEIRNEMISQNGIHSPVKGNAGQSNSKSRIFDPMIF